MQGLRNFLLLLFDAGCTVDRTMAFCLCHSRERPTFLVTLKASANTLEHASDRLFHNNSLSFVIKNLLKQV